MGIAVVVFSFYHVPPSLPLATNRIALMISNHANHFGRNGMTPNESACEKCNCISLRRFSEFICLKDARRDVNYLDGMLLIAKTTCVGSALC